MFSQYPNLSAILNGTYGKTVGQDYKDVAIRTAALRFAVDSFDVEIDRDTSVIGGRASVFEAYLRGGIEGVRNLASDHNAKVRDDRAKDGRIADLEQALYAIGTAFAAWEKAVRTDDNYFTQWADLSSANAEFHTTLTRVLSSTPMPEEVVSYQTFTAQSLPELFDILGKSLPGFMGRPSGNVEPPADIVTEFKKQFSAESMLSRVPDCGNPECLVHKPGGLIDTAAGMAKASATEPEKPEAPGL